MAQNEQTTEEHSTLEQQSPGRLGKILTAAGRQNADGSSRVVAAAAGAETVWGGG